MENELNEFGTKTTDIKIGSWIKIGRPTAVLIGEVTAVVKTGAHIRYYTEHGVANVWDIMEVRSV